ASSRSSPAAETSRFGGRSARCRVRPASTADPPLPQTPVEASRGATGGIGDSLAAAQFDCSLQQPRYRHVHHEIVGGGEEAIGPEPIAAKLFGEFEIAPENREIPRHNRRIKPPPRGSLS